jgi:glycosyltransferase involved in cell wall biosynthesis
MKILHYVDENRLSWAVPWLQLLKGLENAGLHNVIACRPGGTLEGLARGQGFEVATYRPSLQSIPALCRGFGKIVSNVKPDLIHTRLSSAALIGGYWGKKAGIPVVSTVDKYPKGKYYKNTDLLFACSTAVASHMLAEGFPREQVVVVHNPVETSRYKRDDEKRAFFRREQGVEEDDLVILGAGRLVDWKGFDLLARAFSRVQAPRSFLWIAGSGPEEGKIREEIERTGARAKLFPFAEDIRSHLWAADVFAQPSTEPEGFSLMLLEAMSAGLPVIATRIGGTTDILQDVPAGRTIEPGNEQELTDALRQTLHSTREELLLMGKFSEGRSRGFSISRIVEKTLIFYKGLYRPKIRGKALASERE